MEFYKTLSIDNGYTLNVTERTTKELIDPETGELVKIQMKNIVRKMRPGFVVMSIDFIDVFLSMSVTAKKLLGYIIKNMKLRSEIIEFDFKDVETKIQLKETSIYNGIKELTDLKVIAKRKADVYYINTFYIYRGNREKFFKQVESSDEERED